MLQRKVAATARRDGGESASKENGRTPNRSWSDRWKTQPDWDGQSCPPPAIILPYMCPSPRLTGLGETTQAPRQHAPAVGPRNARDGARRPRPADRRQPPPDPARRADRQQKQPSTIGSPRHPPEMRRSCRRKRKQRGEEGGGGKGPVRSIARVPRGGSPRLPYVAVERKEGGSERGEGDSVHQAPPAPVADRHYSQKRPRRVRGVVPPLVSRPPPQADAGTVAGRARRVVDGSKKGMQGRAGRTASRVHARSALSIPTRAASATAAGTREGSRWRWRWLPPQLACRGKQNGMAWKLLLTKRTHERHRGCLRKPGFIIRDFQQREFPDE